MLTILYYLFKKNTKKYIIKLPTKKESEILRYRVYIPPKNNDNNYNIAYDYLYDINYKKKLKKSLIQLKLKNKSENKSENKSDDTILNDDFQLESSSDWKKEDVNMSSFSINNKIDNPNDLISNYPKRNLKYSRDFE